MRYVERNAKKANLVKKAESWRWSSVWRREYGSSEQKDTLSLWPVEAPRGYIGAKLAKLVSKLVSGLVSILERMIVLLYNYSVWEDRLASNQRK